MTKQTNPFERFIGAYEVGQSTIPAPNAEITYQPVAGNHGIYSIWRHGEAETFYEAHALWGYASTSNRVTVFEINTLGVVATHLGSFDDAGTLSLERLDGDGLTVLERRVFSWSDDDTLDMTLDIVDGEHTTHHAVRIVRRKKTNG